MSYDFRGLSSVFRVMLGSVCIHTYFHCCKCFIASKSSRIWSSENAYGLVNFKYFGTTQHVNKISDLELTHAGINLACDINCRRSIGELNIWQWIAVHIMHILGLVHGILLFFVTARQQNTEVQYCKWWWASFTHIPFSQPVFFTLPSSHHTASSNFQQVNRQKFFLCSYTSRQPWRRLYCPWSNL